MSGALRAAARRYIDAERALDVNRHAGDTTPLLIERGEARERLEAALAAAEDRSLPARDAPSVIDPLVTEGNTEFDADGDPIRPDPHSEDWYDGYAFAQLAAEDRSRVEGLDAERLYQAHGYTCGLCRWGRDKPHDEDDYQNHLKVVHNLPRSPIPAEGEPHE